MISLELEELWISNMFLNMKTEMVTPGKSPITEVTLEGFHSCVFPVVSRQFV